MSLNEKVAILVIAPLVAPSVLASSSTSSYGVGLIPESVLSTPGIVGSVSPLLSERDATKASSDQRLKRVGEI